MIYKYESSIQPKLTWNETQPVFKIPVFKWAIRNSVRLRCHNDTVLQAVHPKELMQKHKKDTSESKSSHMEHNKNIFKNNWTKNLNPDEKLPRFNLNTTYASASESASVCFAYRMTALYSDPWPLGTGLNTEISADVFIKHGHPEDGWVIQLNRMKCSQTSKQSASKCTSHTLRDLSFKWEDYQPLEICYTL